MLLENYCSRPPGLLPSAGGSCTSCWVIWTVLFVELLGVSAFKDHLQFSAQVIFKAPGWSYMPLENGALENGNSIAMIFRSGYQRVHMVAKGPGKTSGKLKIRESVFECFGIECSGVRAGAPTDLWAGGWRQALALGMCFQEVVLANLNLLPELRLLSTFLICVCPSFFCSWVRWVKWPWARSCWTYLSLV